MNIKAGILAIGDEVVQGQITNRNASWLATELSKININTTHHIACLDKSEDISHSLNFLSTHCQLIIASGGLGPTLDDCTRKSIAQWMGTDLLFDEPSWKDIESLLKSRQLTIREGHRNQAYFPKDSKILNNPNGVAPGFCAQTKQKTFIASLPGPPTELQAMFSEELKPYLLKTLNPTTDQKLYKWICLGAPESEVAHIAESILSHHSSFSIGYRLKKPYVELKVWGPNKLNDKENKLFLLLEEKLSPWFISNSIDDIREEFHNKISTYDNIYVIDHLTSGLLLEKLKENDQSSHIRYQCFEKNAYRYFTENEVLQIYQHMGADKNKLFICLFPHSDSSAIIFFNGTSKIISIPRKISLTSRLGQLYAIENLFLLGNTIL